MGSALISGLLAHGWASAEDCLVVERYEEVRAELTKRFPQLHVAAEPPPGESLVLAVKPQDLEATCRELPSGSFDRVLSIAAGVPTERIESWLWSGVRVLRAMPNTPALLGVGASAVAPGTNATEDDVIWAESVLSAIGMVVSLPEELLDATTGLSGSGPAYIFLVAEALIAAGIEVGLSPEVSRVLTLQTVLGAARMLSESGESPEELRAAVTSPNGTTAEGIKVMEERGLREILSAAVRAATERSKELGRG